MYYYTTTFVSDHATLIVTSISENELDNDTVETMARANVRDYYGIDITNAGLDSVEVNVELAAQYDD
jgi:hypothetical protein